MKVSIDGFAIGGGIPGMNWSICGMTGFGTNESGFERNASCIAGFGTKGSSVIALGTNAGSGGEFGN
jgi:hypothetical protein